MKDYGGALKKLRKHFGFTQQQLAEKLSVSYQTVSKWETGTNQIDLDTIRTMCDVLGVSLDAFIKIADGMAVNDALAPEPVQPASTPTPPQPVQSVPAPVFSSPVNVVRKLTPLEYVLAVLMLVPSLVFGAIGGAVGGVIECVNLYIMPKIETLWLKIVIAVEICAVAGFAAFWLAYAVGMLFW